MLNSPVNSWPDFIVGCKCYFFPFLLLSWSLGFDKIVLAVGLGMGLPISAHIFKNMSSCPSSCLIILAPELMMGFCTYLPHHLSGFCCWCLFFWLELEEVLWLLSQWLQAHVLIFPIVCGNQFPWSYSPWEVCS